MRTVGALGEAEAIAADDGAVLQDHAMADAAEFAHHGVRVGQKIVADLRAFVDHGVRMQHGIAADRDTLAYHRERTDGSVLADAGAGGHCGQGMDAGRGARRLIEQRQRTREIEIRIRRYYRGDGRIPNRLRDEDGRGLG